MRKSSNSNSSHLKAKRYFAKRKRSLSHSGTTLIPMRIGLCKSSRIGIRRMRTKKSKKRKNRKNRKDSKKRERMSRERRDDLGHSCGVQFLTALFNYPSMIHIQLPNLYLIINKIKECLL